MCWPSTEAGPQAIPGLAARGYRRHAVHGEDRAWPETNCYTDLMVELAHAQGMEPLAMLPCTLGIGFEGDQWTFFKPPAAELFDLYGFDVQELQVWRPLADHVVEQVRAGNPVLVEVDAHWLPDTAGTAYRIEHSKTTIGVNRIDMDGERLGYFHNAGYFELSGEDFRATFKSDRKPGYLPPYVEYVKPRREFSPPRGAALVEASLANAPAHLARAPGENPFPRFRARFAEDQPKLVCKDFCFHEYSFANLRQFGACYELASAWLRWLGANGVDGVDGPAASLEAIAHGAKAFQFQLARGVARGRDLDLAPLDEMARHWDSAFSLLRARWR
jgi:hypothetical protein